MSLSRNIDCFCVTETWLTDKASLGLRDYTIFRLHRQGKGGGVLIAVSKVSPGLPYRYWWN